MLAWVTQLDRTLFLMGKNWAPTCLVIASASTGGFTRSNPNYLERNANYSNPAGSPHPDYHRIGCLHPPNFYDQRIDSYSNGFPHFPAHPQRRGAGVVEAA